MLNHPMVQPVLGKLDRGEQDHAWTKDIPIAGDWYAYDPYNLLQKTDEACINIVTDGTNLYVRSSYPSSFQGEFEVELCALFASE